MSGFNMNEWIARSPTEVFDFIAASENAPKVAPNIKSMVELTEGTVGVGTRYRETRLMNGKETQAELEIVDFEPGQRYAMKNVTDGIVTIYRYNFNQENDGTRVNLVCELNASGVKKLMLTMVASILKKEDGDHLQRLKKVMENGS
jgi:hypothetical protein